MQAVLEALIASFSTSLNHLACFVSSKSACRAMATNISKPKTMTATIIRHLAEPHPQRTFRAIQLCTADVRLECMIHDLELRRGFFLSSSLYIPINHGFTRKYTIFAKVIKRYVTYTVKTLHKWSIPDTGALTIFCAIS